MKKIFWTSVVWILLVIAFVFYVKWFNQPIAEWVANFVVKDGGEIENCIAVTGEVLDDNGIASKLDTLEEHMNTIEDLIEIQNAVSTPDQFDTISPMDIAEPTEDELFDEFKTWYEENK